MSSAYLQVLNCATTTRRGRGEKSSRLVEVQHLSAKLIGHLATLDDLLQLAGLDLETLLLNVYLDL